MTGERASPLGGELLLVQRSHAQVPQLMESSKGTHATYAALITILKNTTYEYTTRLEGKAKACCMETRTGTRKASPPPLDATVAAWAAEAPS